jgi:hypothetical protein
VIEGMAVVNAIPERDPGRARTAGETLVSMEIVEE